MAEQAGPTKAQADAERARKASKFETALKSLKAAVEPLEAIGAAMGETPPTGLEFEATEVRKAISNLKYWTAAVAGELTA